MHSVAFNGSPRNKGNTHKMLARILERCEENGFTTELIHMGSDPHACKDCGLCRKNMREWCYQKSDPFINEWFAKMVSANGIILGSPVYGGWLTPVMKGFIEKSVYIARAPIKRGEKYTVLRNKIGIAVCSTRRSGGIQTLQSLISMFAHTQMIMPCGGQWPIASFGSMDTDAFLKDINGVAIIDKLAENFVKALVRFHGNNNEQYLSK